MNCVDYFPGGEKPYIITGADDKTVKVWDYQTKACVQTLKGHSHNVSVVAFHPELPLILTGSEDATIRIWHSNTYRLENTLNYGLGRVWALGCLPGSNSVAFGYDEGAAMIQMGREEPVASMDATGKIIWAFHNEIQTVNIRAATESVDDLADGEVISVATRDLGACEVYPQSLKHNPNGRFVVVCGDGEYIIYTARSWRNRSFGPALEFAWSADSAEYAVRESASTIKIFNSFEERKKFKPPYTPEGLFGGQLMALKSSSFVCFYDWETTRIIRRIDVVPVAIYWSDAGDTVCIACEESFYILTFNLDAVNAALSSPESEEDGIEDSFELVEEVSETVATGLWVGDCFIYTNKQNRLNYFVGNQVVTISHLDRPMYLLGYVAASDRLFLIDRETRVVKYTLLQAVLEYQTAIIRRDLEAAAEILPSIPDDHRSRIAHFLESQELPELALEVAVDPEHRFDLAVSLGQLDLAYEIALGAPAESKWRQLGGLALRSWQIPMATDCFSRADDISGLLLLNVATGNRDAMAALAAQAESLGKNNVAFVSFFLLGEVEKCIELLCSTDRIPEAAFLARTYMPSKVSDVVKLWREDLGKVNKKMADALADPLEYENMFPDIALGIKAEALFKAKRATPIPAADYLDHVDDINIDMIEAVLNAYDDNNDGAGGVGGTSDDLAYDAATLDVDVVVDHSGPVDMPESEAAPDAAAAAEEDEDEAEVEEAAPEPEVVDPEPEPEAEPEVEVAEPEPEAEAAVEAAVEEEEEVVAEEEVEEKKVTLTDSDDDSDDEFPLLDDEI